MSRIQQAFILFLAFAQPSLGLPQCVSRDVGCPIDSNNVVDTIFGIGTWNECRELCADSSECAVFIWYGPDSSPFTETCHLLNEACQVQDCPGCVSGPPECDTCSIEFACQVGDSQPMGSKRLNKRFLLKG